MVQANVVELQVVVDCGGLAMVTMLYLQPPFQETPSKLARQNVQAEGKLAARASSK